MDDDAYTVQTGCSIGGKEEKVRVGIRAPKNVSVHRKEIYEQIHEEPTEGSDRPNET